MAWPNNWEERVGGIHCVMCTEGRPDSTPVGLRVLEGQHLDAYLGLEAAQRGYVVAIWRGRHVVELSERTATELGGYWREVALVAAAMLAHYEPRKLNYETLGNQVPHLHSHVTARFADGDVAPGSPLPAGRSVRLAFDEAMSDAAALRSILSSSGSA